MPRERARLALYCLLVVPSACGSRAPYDRDWERHPAIIEVTTESAIVALGDVHGGYDRMVALLQAGGLVSIGGGTPPGLAWTGGSRVLVCTGDLIDKGDRALPAIDLLVALAPAARAAGGDVIVTLGNHEAALLADPADGKVTDFVRELEAQGIDARELPRGQMPYGEWLRTRPFAARINGWFFSHGGNGGGRTLSALSAALQAAVSEGAWDAPVLLGPASLLESEKWWEAADKPTALLDQHLDALGARHFVFGHDPGALDQPGTMAQGRAGRLFLVDVGMSPAIDYSRGALLFIERGAGAETATAMDATGARRELWRGPLP